MWEQTEVQHLRELIEAKLDKLYSLNELQMVDLSELKQTNKDQRAICGRTHEGLTEILQNHEQRLGRIEANIGFAKWLLGAMAALLAGIGAIWTGWFGGPGQ
jgi:hypothetical protein